MLIDKKIRFEASEQDALPWNLCREKRGFVQLVSNVPMGC